jgi:hypothetical protein
LPAGAWEGALVVKELLLAHLFFGVVALLVVAFVAFPYRGRAVPRTGRLSESVASLADRVDPGEGPAHGVLTTPEKSKAMSRRFETAEQHVRRGAKVVVTAGRG